MAHTYSLVSAMAAFMVLSISPIASATSPELPPQTQEVVAQPVPPVSTPAQNANMLSLEMCGEREQVVKELSTQFNESPMAIGQVDGSAVVEIFVSEKGSWTILATGTDGMSCIVSAGENFESTTLVRGVDA